MQDSIIQRLSATAADAREALDGDSNDAEHEALFDLTEAIEEFLSDHERATDPNALQGALEHVQEHGFGDLVDADSLIEQAAWAHLGTQQASNEWPVHIIVLQLLRDPDTDDPINWDWTDLLDQQHEVTFVTGGVLGHADPDEYGN